MTPLKGTLYLIPITIADGQLDTIPKATMDIIHGLAYFVAENARTARRFISSTKPPYSLQDVTVEEYGKHDTREPGEYLKPLAKGVNIGVMSEAGCPGIADPGALLAKWAHAHDYKVIPLSGPSSILLALMASGLNGQKFAFHGYLPRDVGDLQRELKSLEHQSRKSGSAEIFIETPYRNRQIFETACNTLAGATKMTVAIALTGEQEYVKTLPIAKWKATSPPDLHKIPAVFILQAD